MLLPDKNSLIYGCMNLGGGWNNQNLSNTEIKAAHAALHTAIENGIHTFDHADIYMHGKSEEVFGEFIKDNRNLRDHIRIQSKAGIVLQAGPQRSNMYNSSKAYIIGQVEQTLKRLNIDYLDTFFIHRPDPLTSYEELTETLSILLERKLTLHIGVSNMSVEQLHSINKALDVDISANQIQFSLGHSQLIDHVVSFNLTHASEQSTLGMLDYAQLNDMELQAWSSLDRGRFIKSDLYGETEIEKDTRLLLEKLAINYETNPLAIQLSWIMNLPVKIHPIIGTTHPERIRMCAESDNVKLSKEDWYALWITARGNPLP